MVRAIAFEAQGPGFNPTSYQVFSLSSVLRKKLINCQFKIVHCQRNNKPQKITPAVLPKSKKAEIITNSKKNNKILQEQFKFNCIVQVLR